MARAIERAAGVVEVDAIERAICPGEGACGGMYTANTMASVAEAMGMSLPGSAAPPSADRRRDVFAHRSGEAVVNLLRQGVTARDVMTTDLATATEDASAEQIARMMEQRGIRRVLIVRDGLLVGLVSRADLLRALLAPAAPAAAGDDAAIQRAMLAALREQPWTDTFWIIPSVRGGVVTLYGYARSEAVRRGLRTLAEGVPGVTQVDDQTEPMPAVLRITL